jgi:Helix-turn-helix domain
MRTVNDIAEYFDVNRETVTGWIKSGELVAIDCGGGRRTGKKRQHHHWKVEDAEFERFKETRRSKPAVKPGRPRKASAATGKLMDLVNAATKFV